MKLSTDEDYFSPVYTTSPLGNIARQKNVEYYILQVPTKQFFVERSDPEISTNASRYHTRRAHLGKCRPMCWRPVRRAGARRLVRHGRLVALCGLMNEWRGLVESALVLGEQIQPV